MDKMVPDPTPILPPSIPEIQAQIDHLEAAHKAKGHPLTGRIIHLCHHLPVEITRILPPVPVDDEETSDDSTLKQTEQTAGVDSSEAGIGIGLTSGVIRGQAANFAAAQSGVLSPPRTPEFKESESLTLSSGGDSEDIKWKLQARRGHTAMISGMRSLSSTHEQIVIAWTGDIMQEHESAPSPRVQQGEAGDAAAAAAAAETELAALGEAPAVYLPELNDVERKNLEKELQNFSSYEQEKEGRGKLSYVPVFVGQEEAKGHYEGYCKTSGWNVQDLVWVCVFPCEPEG
jgi:trehalose 6-phosphate synthase/phosphatase